MKLEIYKGRGVQPWRWRVKSKNGKKIACSGEGFTSRTKAERSFYKLIVDLDDYGWIHGRASVVVLK